MSALRLINETSFSNVASATITDIFSADFDIYKITVTDYDAGGGGANLNYRFVNKIFILILKFLLFFFFNILIFCETFKKLFKKYKNYSE